MSSCGEIHTLEHLKRIIVKAPLYKNNEKLQTNFEARIVGYQDKIENIIVNKFSEVERNKV
ncbi:hypothetical protein [Sulfolobus sp. E11-6]|uniref:hypothetical protein n=1 Tax=Sulfolobus sp. E11-6 TaxID=2663020 RepID=UPI00129725A1|nr:hypothetical protein [Sulfolobus sp. E11-6]QGA68119.1 hypothetical protein GFS33_04390 [Sulfolobus sp. E11-6]